MPRVKKEPIVENKKPALVKKSPLSVPVYSLTGVESGSLELPKELFGMKVNDKLLAQAARVYLANQKSFTANTKTRGEVRGSTAKIFRQKGTGRARHGSITAPIFVGGGIVFGPRFRQVKLDLPKKMKKAALISALSAKVSSNEVMALSGLEKASGKTSQMAALLNKLNKGKESILIVVGEKVDGVMKAVKNIPHVAALPAESVSAYEVLKYKRLFLTKESVEKLNKRILGS